MTKEQALEKLQNNEQLQKFQDFMKDKNLSYHSLTLVGGAVIDVLNDKTPKDYDFIINANKDYLVEAGWKFLHSTSTADTYNFDGVICQVLKKPIEDFEFTISQSRISIKGNKISDIYLDLVSFNNKILIPCGWERKHAKDCLLRIPHYRKKGYTISDETYLSLVRIGMRAETTGINS